MACRLDGAKPLSESMAIYYQLDLKVTYFNEILFEIEIFSFKQMRLNMSFAKWRPSVQGWVGVGGVKVDATMFTIKRLICEACRSLDLS